jgi:serine O-acetyltransferase
MIKQLMDDAVHLARAELKGTPSLRQVLHTAAMQDSYTVLALQRVRNVARELRIPVVGRALRLFQTALYSIEIGKDVTLGKGVSFAHTLGIVIGGDARIGDRVRFMGNNTVGTARDDGFPIIEEDVLVGCGARVLGPIRVGARSVIGANAVVLEDVPPDSLVVGMPARSRPLAAGPRGSEPKARVRRGPQPL